MLKKLLEIIKPLAAAALLLGFLHFTGLLGSVSYVAQSAILKTGALNADASSIRDPENFDFNFTVKSSDGKKINFDQFKGKVVFLNLWATWCGPCRAEMPGIESLYKKSDSANVVFVMLSVDKVEDTPKIARFIDKYQYSFPVYQPSGYLTEQLNVPAIPTTFIISKSGKVVSKEVGATHFDTAKFRKFLDRLAAE